MPDHDLDPLGDPKLASAILDAERPTLAALPTELVERPRVSAPRALELTHALKQNLAPYVSRFAEELSAERAALRRQQLERVTRRAIAFVAADQHALLVPKPLLPDDIVALRKRVAATDQKLVRFALAHFADDTAADEALDAITPGSGTVDSAEDVIALCALFRPRLAALAGRSEVTAELLDAAERDATAALALELPTPDKSATDLTHRAYSAWLADYVDLARTGRYFAGLTRSSTRLFPAPYQPGAPKKMPSEPQQP